MMKHDEDLRVFGGEEESPTSSSCSHFQLGHLPDVFIQHLAPFLKWSSRRSLSQVNSRFRAHFGSLLNQASSLSVKGQASVGVGDLENVHRVTYLSEFYTIRVEMDSEMVVEWTLKVDSGIRTVVQIQYDGEEWTETTRSVSLSSRDYLMKILKWILGKYQFKKIHLGVSGLTTLFDTYTHKVDDVGVSNEVDSLKLAERLSPKKLSLFQPNQLNYKKGSFDITKFPRLEELRMFGVPVDLDQVLESKLVNIVADTFEGEIKLKHAKKLIQNWQSGASDYKRIEITCSTYRNPIYFHHTKWYELGQNNRDEFYDNILNHKDRLGTLSYSTRRLEFAPWQEDQRTDMNIWNFRN